MNRREMIYTAGAAAAGLAMSEVLLAKGEHSHHAHKAGKHDDLVGIASECVNKGELCLTHCLTEFGKGNKAMAECAVSVRDMLASCQALVKMAAADSKHLKKMAAVCEAVCNDCAKACKKHAKMHATCKACMEACLECAKACGKIA